MNVNIFYPHDPIIPKQGISVLVDSEEDEIRIRKICKEYTLREDYPYSSSNEQFPRMPEVEKEKYYVAGIQRTFLSHTDTSKTLKVMGNSYNAFDRSTNEHIQLPLRQLYAVALAYREIMTQAQNFVACPRVELHASIMHTLEHDLIRNYLKISIEPFFDSVTVSGEGFIVLNLNMRTMVLHSYVGTRLTEVQRKNNYFDFESIKKDLLNEE